MPANYKAPAKVNVFLKITGKREGYHEIISRFMQVSDLYDTLHFAPKSVSGFELVGDFTCKLEENTIYKAYIALLEATGSNALEQLMAEQALHVNKRIPAFAGLGGGSSDAATYLKMCNEAARLQLSPDALAQIGAKVGADVPFFVYGYTSANVSGIGEVVEAFEEAALDFEIVTPNVKISTPKVYKAYREHFYNPVDAATAAQLAQTPSRDILSTMSATEANDLFAPALHCYGDLALHVKPGWFFSGSGSSFFRVKEPHG